jgi:hypothetical protein
MVISILLESDEIVSLVIMQNLPTKSADRVKEVMKKSSYLRLIYVLHFSTYTLESDRTDG